MSISTRTALRQLPRLTLRQPLRRLAHSSPPHEVHPKAEGFGLSFYMTLALIPTSYILYAVSTGSSDGLVARGVRAYGDLQQTWVRRNALHTRMVEQAGHDRNLFQNSNMPNHIDLRFPEVFNVGSPYNVPAGHYANIDKLVAHYREKQFAEEEEKLTRMREGKALAMGDQSQRLTSGESARGQ